eukprot:720992_1
MELCPNHNTYHAGIIPRPQLYEEHNNAMVGIHPCYTTVMYNTYKHTPTSCCALINNMSWLVILSVFMYSFYALVSSLLSHVYPCIITRPQVYGKCTRKHNLEEMKANKYYTEQDQ